MISLRNFSMRRGERLLLSNVDLTMHAGYRVGVVGRNGTGKSSLFAAVKGELEADKGDVDPHGQRFAGNPVLARPGAVVRTGWGH